MSCPRNRWDRIKYFAVQMLVKVFVLLVQKYMFKKIENSVRFFFGLITCILLRLVQPFPNVEPIMATMMPFAGKFGKVSGFLFASVSLVSFDFISGRLGMWTVYTGIAYGLVGIAASVFLGGIRNVSRRHFVAFAFFGTIFYDAVTAFFFGLQFHQPLLMTAVAQVPFTLYHLAGNLVFAAAVSPLIQKHIVENKSLALSALVSTEPLPVSKTKQ